VRRAPASSRGHGRRSRARQASAAVTASTAADRARRAPHHGTSATYPLDGLLNGLIDQSKLYHDRDSTGHSKTTRKDPRTRGPRVLLTGQEHRLSLRTATDCPGPPSASRTGSRTAR